MSAELVKAAAVRAPNDNEEAENFQCLLFTCGTTVLLAELPDLWSGRHVIVYNEGAAAARFTFSTHDDADIEHTPTAADAGEPCAPRIGPGSFQRRRLPKWTPGAQKMYFVRRSASTTSISLELGDGE